MQKQITSIPSSVRTAVGIAVHLISDPELDLAAIEATSEAKEIAGVELEKAIIRKAENRRSRFANGALSGTAQFWQRVREQATDEARRILTGTSSEAAEIELLRAEANDKLSKANARQADFQRKSAELAGLPKKIAAITESLGQVVGAKDGLDKAKLEEAFKHAYMQSVYANDVALFHRHRQEADALFLALSSRSLRLEVLEKAEAEISDQLKKLTDRQAELEAALG